MAKWKGSIASPMAVPVKDSDLAKAIAELEDVNLSIDTVLSEEEVEWMETHLSNATNLLKQIRRNNG